MGDERAFGEVYREHAGRVYALCLRMSGDRAAADELVQDVFVRAWERLRSFRGQSAFSSWLYRLTVNVVLMRRRATRRREQRVFTTGEPDRLERGGGPARAAEGLDLERAVAALPDGAREVLVLHDIEGYTHAEIGRACGIAAGTSKAQLFRARRLLREMLER